MDTDILGLGAALSQEDNAAHFDPVLRDPISYGSPTKQTNAFRDGEEMPHNAVWGSGDEGEDYTHFLDAGSVPSTENMQGSGFVPIRAHISDDVDDEYEGDVEEGSLGSTGSYDSASERMVTASITDLASPVGSFVEPSLLSEVASATQKGALRQLNELNSGFSSLDTSLLESTNEEGFRSRVMEIAESKSVSPDDDVIHSIITALLPIVGKRVKENGSLGDEALDDIGNYTRIMPVAKPTIEDDENTDGVDDVELESSQADTNEAASDSEQLEGDILPGSARGLRVRGVDEESKEQEDSCLPPSSMVRPAFSSMSSDQEELEGGSGSGVQVASYLAAENADPKQEPEACVYQYIELLGVKAADNEHISGKNVESPVEHDLLAKGEPLVSSSNDPALHVQDPGRAVASDGKDAASAVDLNSTGTEDELLAGKPGKERDDAEGEAVRDSCPEILSLKPQNKAGDWHPDDVCAGAGPELEQAGISNLGMALPTDDVECFQK